MRNSLKYIFVGIILFVAMSGKVGASEATCTYNVGYNNDGKVKCSVSEDSDKPSCEVESGNYSTGEGNYLINVNFQDTANEKWKCPSKIYYVMYMKAAEDVRPTIGYFASKEKDSEQGITGKYYSTVKEATLDTTNSSDGNKLDSYSSSPKCIYGSLLLEIDEKNKTIKPTYKSNLCHNLTFDFSYDDLSGITKLTNGCPKQVYVSNIEGYCTYSFIKKAGFGRVNYDFTESVVDGTGESVNDPSVEVPKDYVHGCDNIPETAAFVKKIYSLLKYLIPVLVIGLSIVDFVKVLLNGEEKIYKEAWSKFVKRIVVGIIILILPVLLSFIINLSGVTENYGINGNNIFCILK